MASRSSGLSSGARVAGAAEPLSTAFGADADTAAGIELDADVDAIAAGLRVSTAWACAPAGAAAKAAAIMAAAAALVVIAGELMVVRARHASSAPRCARLGGRRRGPRVCQSRRHLGLIRLGS